MALPAETTTGTCFLQLFIESILALQEASSRLTKGLYDISFVRRPSTFCGLFINVAPPCDEERLNVSVLHYNEWQQPMGEY